MADEESRRGRGLFAAYHGEILRSAQDDIMAQRGATRWLACSTFSGEGQARATAPGPPASEPDAEANGPPSGI